MNKTSFLVCKPLFKTLSAFDVNTKLALPPTEGQKPALGSVRPQKKPDLSLARSQGEQTPSIWIQGLFGLVNPGFSVAAVRKKRSPRQQPH
jgi:hypothetical protein